MDIFEAIVIGSVDSDDAVAKVVADPVPVVPVMKSDRLILSIVRAALCHVGARLAPLKDVARANVEREAAALVQSDAMTVRAVTDEDLAAERARRVINDVA